MDWEESCTQAADWLATSEPCRNLRAQFVQHAGPEVFQGGWRTLALHRELWATLSKRWDSERVRG